MTELTVKMKNIILDMKNDYPISEKDLVNAWVIFIHTFAEYKRQQYIESEIPDTDEGAIECCHTLMSAVEKAYGINILKVINEVQKAKCDE
jgi:hypothetical protein